MRAKIIVFRDDERVKVYTIREGQRFTIGRSTKNDVAIPDIRVSRFHCAITEKDGQHVLEDLGSLNATILNGKPVKKATLVTGDKIKIGPVVVEFITPATVAPVPGTAGEIDEDSDSSEERFAEFFEEAGEAGTVEAAKCASCGREISVEELDAGSAFIIGGIGPGRPGARVMRPPREAQELPGAGPAVMPSAGPAAVCPDCLEKDPLLGKDFHGFVPVRKFASGGMSNLYEAVQVSLDRRVVIKILSARGTSNDDAVLRFEREAKIGASLSHPNLVQILDVGNFSLGVFYIAMEYVRGKTALELLREKRQLTVSEVMRIGVAVLQALTYLHQHGVVHRDVKPSNIMLAEDGGIKLADLGLAKLIEGEEAGLTHHGESFGTYQYMSPEQIRSARDVGPKSDLYSLGVALYYLLCGRKPFRGKLPVELSKSILSGVHQPLCERRTELPQGLCDVVEEMMATKPEDRCESAAAALEKLLAVARRENIQLD